MILLFRAPNGIENISNIHPKYYPYLKGICIAMVLINIFGFNSTELTAVFLIQALSVTHSAYKIIYSLERRLIR
jgi:hypothetical protein